MKWTSLIILLLLFTICLKGQDSTNISVEKFNNLNEKVVDNQKTIDSLKATLNNLNVKNSFFESELSMQTGLFSVIVAGILVITGLLSWGIFKYELNHYNKKLDKKIKKIDNDLTEFNTQFVAIKDQVYHTSFGANKIISDFLLKDNSYFTSIKFAILSGYYLSLISDNSNIISDSRKIQLILFSLNFAIKVFKEYKEKALDEIKQFAFKNSELYEENISKLSDRLAKLMINNINEKNIVQLSAELQLIIKEMEGFEVKSEVQT